MPPDDSPVLALRTRIEHEQGRWVVYADAVCIPDRDDYVVTHRIGDYATREQALVAARLIERTANR
jgi:hypothetical protein